MVKGKKMLLGREDMVPPQCCVEEKSIFTVFIMAAVKHSLAHGTLLLHCLCSVV